MKTGIAVQNGRGRTPPSSEDRHFWTDLPGESAICGVFDGHSGLGTVNITIQQFPEMIRRTIEPYENGDSAELTRQIKMAFLKHDDYIKSQGTLRYRDSGTTATMVYIGKKNVIFAYLGDSPACIIDPDTGAVIAMAGRHDPASPGERKRIEEAGGFVSEEAGDVPRVDGELAVSRAFGDYKYKIPKALVSAEPDVIIVPRPAKGILAVFSDGLLENEADQMNLKTTEEVAKAIQAAVKESGGDYAKAASLVVGRHIAESGTLADYQGDDLTLILADIGKPLVGGATTRRAFRGRRGGIKTGKAKRLLKTFTI
jgi:serine/threonine protein phosphatase PrpC